jgi:AP-3 complex subunit sigma
MGGMVLETNVAEIVMRIEEQNKLERDEVMHMKYLLFKIAQQSDNHDFIILFLRSQAGISAAPARAVSAVKNLNISQQFKDMKLPDLPAAIKDLNLKL